MDFSIPENLRSLKVSLRCLVETRLKPHDAVIEENGQIPPQALDAIRAFGLFGSNTPQRYGGLGLDMLGNCLVIEEMARTHIAYFYTYSMNVHIASKGIELHGSEAQRERWLPGLASGRAIGCYALTEEGAGSDAAALRTTAVRSGDSYVLNGAKRYITNAPVADLFTVFAAHPDAGAKPRISAFVVEKTTPGLRIGKVIPMAGGRGAFHSEVFFENLSVPLENRLGKEGEGLTLAASTGRLIALGLHNSYSIQQTARRKPGHPVDARQHGSRPSRGAARLLRGSMAVRSGAATSRKRRSDG